MCYGFAVIVTKDMNLHWTAQKETFGNDQSHTDILNAAGIEDNTDVFQRDFVRVEFPDWDALRFRFDEQGTLPGWAENAEDEIQNACVDLLERVKPQHDYYAEQRAKIEAQQQNDRLDARAAYDHLSAFAESTLFQHMSEGRIVPPEVMSDMISKGWLKARDECDDLAERRINFLWRDTQYDLKYITGYVELD